MTADPLAPSLENSADVLPKQPVKGCGGPAMKDHLNALGIPASFATRRRSGENANCYVVEFLNFTWPNGFDSPPQKQEPPPPLDCAQQIRAKLNARIIDAFDSCKDWRKNPADHERISTTVIFQLPDQGDQSGETVGTPFLASADGIAGAVTAPRVTPILCLPAPKPAAPSKIIDLSTRARAQAHHILPRALRALPPPPQPIALLPATVPTSPSPCMGRGGGGGVTDAFQVGQLLQIPRSARRLPVQRVIHLQNTYYEFGAGQHFTSGVPVLYRHSETALLAVNPSCRDAILGIRSAQ